METSEWQAVEMNREEPRPESLSCKWLDLEQQYNCHNKIQQSSGRIHFDLKVAELAR